MLKPIKTFRIAEYLVLMFKELPPDFSKIRINDTIYDVVIPYDIPNSIAVKTTDNFNDFAIDFI